MEDKKRPHKNDEIDIVEILGVILKWRRSFFITIISITVLTVLTLSIKEHYRFNPKYFAEVKMDVFFATNNFFDKKSDLNKYKKFVTTLLFPASINTPKFEINTNNNSNLYYLFETEEDMNNFISRYNVFSDTLYELLLSRNSLNSLLVENCKMFFTKSSQFSTPKDISFFFDNEGDIKKCKEYNYYVNFIQDRFTYVFSTPIELGDTYMDFLARFIEGQHDLNKITPIQDSKNKININFNIKKIIKYTMVAFIVSIFLGVIFTFILEFWFQNKKRITGYLK